MPPGSTRPQRAARCHSSSVSRTSSRGWHAIARCRLRSPARRPGAAQKHAARSAATAAPARRKRRRAARTATAPACGTRTARSSRSSGPRSHGCSRSPAPSELGRDPVADLGCRPRARRRSPARRTRAPVAANQAAASCTPTWASDHHRRRDLARDEAHAQVELRGQVVVEVEQVPVRRGRVRCGWRGSSPGHRSEPPSTRSACTPRACGRVYVLVNPELPGRRR